MDFKNFVAPEKLTTKHFVFCCYLPGDGRLLTEALNASYEHLSTFMDWAKPDQSVEASETTVRKLRAKYLSNEDYALGIFAPDESRLLGGSGFHPRE